MIGRTVFSSLFRPLLPSENTPCGGDCLKLFSFQEKKIIKPFILVQMSRYGFLVVSKSLIVIICFLWHKCMIRNGGLLLFFSFIYRGFLSHPLRQYSLQGPQGQGFMIGVFFPEG